MDELGASLSQTGVSCNDKGCDESWKVSDSRISYSSRWVVIEGARVVLNVRRRSRLGNRRAWSLGALEGLGFLPTGRPLTGNSDSSRTPSCPSRARTGTRYLGCSKPWHPGSWFWALESLQAAHACHGTGITVAFKSANLDLTSPGYSNVTLALKLSLEGPLASLCITNLK